MDAIEKLFLSCLVLFGLLIIFLFGLYFDLGDVFTAVLYQNERNATGIASLDQSVKTMEGHAMPREVMPGKLGDSYARVPEPSRDTQAAVLRTYWKMPPPITGADQATNKRKQ